MQMMGKREPKSVTDKQSFYCPYLAYSTVLFLDAVIAATAIILLRLPIKSRELQVTT